MLRRFLLIILTLGTLGACAQDHATQQGSAPPAEDPYPALDPAAYNQVLPTGAAREGVLLDVRTPEEFADGHLVGATLINYYDDDFRAQLTGLDRDTTYYVYCRSGKRSAGAQQIMEELGFRRVVNLAGGFQAWQEAGMASER